MKLIAKRTHQFLEKSVFAINDHVPSSDGFRQTFTGPPDEVLLIGYTFVSKGAIMPILYFPSGWRWPQGPSLSHVFQSRCGFDEKLVQLTSVWLLIWQPSVSHFFLGRLPIPSRRIYSRYGKNPYIRTSYFHTGNWLRFHAQLEDCSRCLDVLILAKRIDI